MDNGVEVDDLASLLQLALPKLLTYDEEEMGLALVLSNDGRGCQRWEAASKRFQVLVPRLRGLELILYNRDKWERDCFLFELHQVFQSCVEVLRVDGSSLSRFLRKFEQFRFLFPQVKSFTIRNSWSPPKEGRLPLLMKACDPWVHLEKVTVEVDVMRLREVEDWEDQWDQFFEGKVELELRGVTCRDICGSTKEGIKWHFKVSGPLVLDSQ